MAKNPDAKGVTVIVSDPCPLVSVEIMSQTEKDDGSTRSLSFDDYSFNGIAIKGTRVTEIMGENNNGFTVFSSTLSDAVLPFPDGSTASREYYHERVWISGFDTPNIRTDECMITDTRQAQGLKTNPVRQPYLLLFTGRGPAGSLSAV